MERKNLCMQGEQVYIKARAIALVCETRVILYNRELKQRRQQRKRDGRQKNNEIGKTTTLHVHHAYRAFSHDVTFFAGNLSRHVGVPHFPTWRDILSQIMRTRSITT